MLKPKVLLHIEGAAVLIVACILYGQIDGGWLRFVLLFLVPDLSMAGYLFDQKRGASIYNLVHTYTTPLLFLLPFWLSGQSTSAGIALIWIAHIGFDRLLGYGLKYETAFENTHLQRL